MQEKKDSCLKKYNELAFGLSKETTKQYSTSLLFSFKVLFIQRLDKLFIVFMDL